MIRTIKNRPAALRSPVTLGLVVLALLTLSLGASAQRTRGSDTKAPTNTRARGADKNSNSSRPARTPQRREKTAKGKKAPAAAAVAETPKADNAEAKTKLGNRKTMENEKHLQRMAVIARIGDLAKEIGNETLAAKVAPLTTKEGDRHRKRLALYQNWTSQLDKGEAVPALGAMAAAAPEDDKPEPKAKGKKKAKAPKKAAAGRKRGADGSRSRGGDKKASGGSRSR